MILGVRIWAGSLSRIFGQDGDPLGRPVEFEYSLPRQVGDDPHGNLVLPEAIGRTNQTDLKSLRMLNSVTTLNCEVAVSLIRSARLYQAALWLSESAPELCWLLLVSSIEVAAGTWSTANDAPWKRLKHSKPELAEQLTRAGGHDHLVAVAEMIKDSLGATKKFELFC